MNEVLHTTRQLRTMAPTPSPDVLATLLAQRKGEYHFRRLRELDAPEWTSLVELAKTVLKYTGPPALPDLRLTPYGVRPFWAAG